MAVPPRTRSAFAPLALVEGGAPGCFQAVVATFHSPTKFFRKAWFSFVAMSFMYISIAFC